MPSLAEIQAMGPDEAIQAVVNATDAQIGQWLLDNAISGSCSGLLWVSVLTTASYRLLGMHMAAPSESQVH